jgi:ribonuclease P protein component
MKSDRLRSKWDFERVFERGTINKSDGFVVYWLPANTEEIRVGICVGKSLGSAVVRNKLKRQIREIIRELDFQREGFDIVIVARKKILGSDFNRLKNSLVGLLSRSRFI